MMEKESLITLKSIYDLLGERFYIPSYQRGYRWADIQVEQLLTDIWEFTKKRKETSEFYCLQPIVVKRYNADSWEVIDGQQRLTTIRIILSYLITNHLKRTLKEAYLKSEYTISYETRPEIEKFLENITESEENIDTYYISEAYKKTQDWFKGKDFNDCNEFLAVLLAKEDNKNPVKIIWYEVIENTTGQSSSIDIFTRINIGKIPLTNAELIKALFLQKGNFNVERVDLKQIQIASEWDYIESILQDNSFWYFIYNPENQVKYDNRIEFIFDLMTKKRLNYDPFYTFMEFQKEFSLSKNKSGKPDIDSIWKNIKMFFLTLEEWYNDRELYHLIGFLIYCNFDINKLLESKEDEPTKTDFKNYLFARIRERISCKLTDLDYHRNRDKIKEVLLFFNIQTILVTKNTDIKFPFNRFKEEEWDIEHIRSITDKQITAKTRKNWALDILEYFTGEKGYSDNLLGESNKTEKEIQINAISFLKPDEQNLALKITVLLNDEVTEDDVFKGIYREIIIHFEEEETPESINSISNLALLDSSTNRSYKNAMFPIKRQTIIEHDMNGVFIPICTKNVFYKSYSKRIGQMMYWKESDANAYLNAIEKTLKNFLPPQMNQNGN